VTAGGSRKNPPQLAWAELRGEGRPDSPTCPAPGSKVSALGLTTRYTGVRQC
jgi:hypothetical protein